MTIENLLCLDTLANAPDKGEVFETFLRGAGGFRVERIVSHGHVTPEGQWYDQEEDEWVLVLRGSARLRLESGREVPLEAGDHMLLPARQKHRVVYTSSPCVWLALFAAKIAG